MARNQDTRFGAFSLSSACPAFLEILDGESESNEAR